MRDSAGRWRIVEIATIFRSYVNFFFFFPHVKETVESWLVFVNKLFLGQDNKTKLVPASFSYFLELLCEKNKFWLKKCDSYNCYNLSVL